MLENTIFVGAEDTRLKDFISCKILGAHIEKWDGLPSHLFFSTTPYFSDVPSTHPFFKYVQKLKDEGITAVMGTYGVGNITVTRAQMAALLTRAFLEME